jgi:transposase-like protein
MTQKQADKIIGNGAGSTRRTDPEVVPKAKRRTFTAAYKLWVLEEADKCREQPGQIGALLRREGLYSSHLTTWRRQREAGQMAGLKPQQRGRKRDEETGEKRTILHRLKPKTRLYFDEFHICRDCAQIYWKGSHFGKLESLISTVIRHELES